MRSPAEIRFRLRQELANAALCLAPPTPPPVRQARLLPRPEAVAERLRTTAFRGALRSVVEQVTGGVLPALGLKLHTGPEIRWRRDYVSGRETAPVYFRRIPYLDASRAGDHKVIWEINRHQHLVALAQETVFPDAHPAALPELLRQLESWLAANPFQRGINWTSALEAAFRALSWIWIDHLAGHLFPPALHGRFTTALYRHGLHLEYNLSIYFSPNTHLLGEALALFALGKLYPQWPRSRHWTLTGARIVEQELHHQVLADGSHFEQSAYYHVYAADMFLFYAVLANPGAEVRGRLAAMAEYLDGLLGPSRKLPLLGDDDGGRFFHPYGDRSRWAAETLAACARLLNRPEWLERPDDLHALAAWWLDDPLPGPAPAPRTWHSRLFVSSGVASLAAGDVQVIADAGPFGPGSAGHSHSDTLSIQVRRGANEILIDPGTYTYVGDPAWRARFRGTAAHNTVRLDGQEQAVPAGPFAWKQPHPRVEILHWAPGGDVDLLAAQCQYAGLLHRRRIVLVKPDQLLLIADEIEGPPGEHWAEWFWHAGLAVERTAASALRIGADNFLVWDASLAAELSEGGDFGWRSPAFGVKEPAPLLRLEYRGPLPVRRAAALHCGAAHPHPLLLEDPATLRYGGLRVRLDTGAVTRT